MENSANDFAPKSFGAQVIDYLSTNKVYELFEYLLRQLIIDQPEDPLQYLLDALRTPLAKRVVLLLPPELKCRGIGQNLASVNGLFHIDTDSITATIDALSGISVKHRASPDQEIMTTVSRVEGGWLLEGFPKTQPQAYAFYKYGIVPSCFIALMDSTTHVQFAQITFDRSSSTHDALASFSIPDNANLRYLRELIEVSDVIEFHICEFDPLDDTTSITARLNGLINREFAVPSVYSPRISVIGPPASGKTTQCQLLAKKYGLYHVDATHLMNEVANNETLKSTHGTNLSGDGECNDRMYDKLLQMLNNEDSQKHGWVLEGFPVNKAHFSVLQKSNLLPSMIIQLDMSLAASTARSELKFFDPLHNLNHFAEHSGESVQAGLVKSDRDNAESVALQYGTLLRELAEVPTPYTEHLSKINCETANIHEVAAKINAIIEGGVLERKKK